VVNSGHFDDSGAGMGTLNSLADQYGNSQTNDKDHPGLGMEKLNFFTARVFNGKIAHAINNTPNCAVGSLPGK